jgi:universal stress protein E
MQIFQNILFVADRSKGSAAVLRKVRAMADHYGASLTVMDVIPDYTGQYGYMESGESLTALQEALKQESEKVLAELLKKSLPKAARTARKKALPIIIRTGTDYIEIIRQVGEGKFDLVAKAANNNTGLGARLFGTLDMQLIRKCPCPVMILKPRKKIDHSRVLAAVDLRTLPGQPRNLDEKVMQFASSLAGMEDGQLDLIHAWHLLFEKKLKNEERVGLYKSIQSMSRELKEVEAKHLQALADEYAALKPQVHLIKGKPEVVIPKFADRKGTDLVIMGSVGRGGVAGFFIGNTAERLLHELNCSVLTIKPAGFKSPVK